MVLHLGTSGVGASGWEFFAIFWCIWVLVDGWEPFCDFGACSVLILVELCSVLSLVDVFGETGNMWR